MEINHVLHHPDNNTEDMFKEEKLTMVGEFGKGNKNVLLIKTQMKLT